MKDMGLFSPFGTDIDLAVGVMHVNPDFGRPHGVLQIAVDYLDLEDVLACREIRVLDAPLARLLPSLPIVLQPIQKGQLLRAALEAAGIELEGDEGK